MKIGTRSLLFGYHTFWLHPWFVALGWWKAYGFPLDPRLWVAFFVHDLGYWGKPNMDGPEGDTHPELGGRIMFSLFDWGKEYTWYEPKFHSTEGLGYWYWFTKYHSRHLAKKDGVQYSPLCVADKLALTLYPRWLFWLLVSLTGEAEEYKTHPVSPGAPFPKTTMEWVAGVQSSMKRWAAEYRDLKEDTYTEKR